MHSALFDYSLIMIEFSDGPSHGSWTFWGHNDASACSTDNLGCLSLWSSEYNRTPSMTAKRGHAHREMMGAPTLGNTLSAAYTA